jgi:hypothetical protein
VVSTVLVASFAGSGVTSGAGTDADSTATPTTAAPTATTVAPTPTVAPANPPASAIEQPVGGTNPDGSQLGANTGTNGLPNTGYGATQNSDATAILFLVLGLAGVSLAGAGALLAGKRSR